MLLGVGVFWWGWRLWREDGRSGDRRSRWRWFLYWLAASALLWADYTGLLVWGLLQLVWLAAGRPQLRRWLPAQTAVFLPWLFLIRQLPASQTLTHSYQPIFVAVQAFKFGVLLPPEQAAILLLAALALAAVLGVLIALAGPRSYRRYPRQLHMLLALLLVGGWLFLILAASIPRLYTLKRLLVPLLPVFALAVAAVTANWRPRRAAALALPGVLVCLLLLPGHQSDTGETAVAQITENAPQGAQLWVDDMVVPAFAYYAGSELDGRWVTLNGRALPQLPAADPGVPIILVTTNSPYRELLPLLPPAFRQTYQLTGEQSWSGIRIYEFWPHAVSGPDALPWPDPSVTAEWGLLLPSPLAACQAP
jgi:hypothetical protein